jgi:ribosomal protein L11 methyltransferase
MLELFPEGFEEVASGGEIELVAYTDAGGEERLWQAFGGARGEDIAADWRDRWKEFHRPVEVGLLWIGPPWSRVPVDRAAVVIEPGRAFGTGAHPTTRLCIELLLDLDRGSVLDLGCGSGVLAIAAAKLGFAPVLAVDDDENAVAAARTNVEANGVDVVVRVLDVLHDELPAADVVLANITRPVLEGIAPRVRAPLLVASGYLPSDPMELPPFRHVRRSARDGWAADVYEAA